MTKTRLLITSLVIVALSAGFGAGHLLIGSEPANTAEAVVAEGETTTPTEAPSIETDLSVHVDELPTSDDSSGDGPEHGENPADPEPIPPEPQEPAEQPVEPDPEPPEPEEPVHELLGGSEGEANPDPEPTHPLGEIEPGSLVPEGLDIAVFPGAPDEPPTTAISGPNTISAGPDCAYQCISSGVAYPRGFGAELVVETKVPADVFMSVIADTNGDGEYDFAAAEWSPGKVTEFSWPLDHLEPGQLYYAMATATDEYNDTSYAWGEFTTLSTRTVEIRVNSAEIDGGPGNISGTFALLRAAGEGYGAVYHEDTHSIDMPVYDFGTWRRYDDVDQNIDVDLYVVRRWDADICEAFWPSYTETPQGHDTDSCAAWNTASATIDLDEIPAGGSRWRSVAFDATLHTPTGAGTGQALPNGYGDPYHFHVTAPMTVNVIYSE